MTAQRRRALVVVALFVVCALLRVSVIRRQGLWADEMFSLAMATGHSLEHPAQQADEQQGDFVERAEPAAANEYRKYLRHDSPPASPARVVRAVFKSDTSPPGYYLLLYAWTRVLGTGDFSLRLLSVAASLACFPLLWWVARQIGGTRAALYACALFTFSPMALYYSTEGRMYSVLWFFTLASMGLTLRLRHRGSDLPTLALWILAVAGGLYTHYFFAFVLAMLGLWLMLYPGRASRGKVIAASVIVALLVLPWYVRIPASLANWRVTGEWLNWLPSGFSRPRSIVLLPWSYFSVVGVWGARAIFDWMNALTILALLAVALFQLRRRAFSPRMLLLWLCVLGACGGVLVFDLWRKTYASDIPRYAIAGFPAAIILLAFAISRLQFNMRWAFTIVILILWLNGDRRIFLNNARQHQLRETASFVSKTASPDDLVIVSSIPSGTAGFARYMSNSLADKKIFVAWIGQLAERKVPQDLIRLAEGKRQIILVKVHEVGAPPDHEDWLWRHSHFANKLTLKNAQVDIFKPNTGERFTADGWALHN